jgi:hypothetical protein
MFNSPSWLNSDQTILTAWTGSTVLTGLQYVLQAVGTTNPIAFVGWFITTLLALIAAYSKWRLNRAEEQERLSEARKNNAEAKLIEHQISNDYAKIIAEQCEVEDCLYKTFYDKITQNKN